MPDETDRRLTALLAALVGLGVALVFMTTFGLLQWRRASGLNHTATLRRSAAATAGQFASTLYTYDSADLPGARARVLRLATQEFGRRYDATQGPEQAAIAKLKAREAGRVTGVFLTDVVRNRAAAVVIVNTLIEAADQRRTGVTYLDVALLHGPTGWKVDRATPVVPTS